MITLQDIAQFLFPKTLNYFDQQRQKSASDMPSAQYMRGQPNASLPKYAAAKFQEDVLNPQAIKSGLEIAPWLIPFGKGATTASKTLIPGATVGALSGLSQDNVTPASLGLSTALGAGGAYGLEKAAGLVPKAIEVLGTKLPETIMEKLLRPAQTKTTTAEVKEIMRGGESMGKKALERDFRGKGYTEMFNKAEEQMGIIGKQIGEAVADIPEKIKKSDVMTYINPYLTKLRKAGNKEVAQSLKSRVDSIFTGQKGGLDLASANEIKQTIYAEARNSYDRIGSESAEGLKMIGNAFMNEIERYAPAVSVPNQEYAFYRKAADALASQAGRGSRNLSFGPVDALFTGIGGLVGGGLPGAIAAYGGRKILQNPGVQSNLAQALNIVGKGTENMANKIPQELTDYLIGQSGSRMGAGLSRLIGEQQTANGAYQQTDNNLHIPSSDGIIPKTQSEGFVSPGGQWIWSKEQNDWVPNPALQGGMQNADTVNPEVRQALTALYLKSPGDYDKITAAYKLMTGTDLIPEENKTKIPSTAVSSIADLDASISLMDQLNTGIEQYAGIMGPVEGQVRRRNPYDTGAQDFDSQMMAVAQTVGKAMEGGVLRAEDVPKYRKILPQITDTPQVAKRKINNVIKLLNEQKQSKISAFQTYPSYGSVTDANISTGTGQ